MRRGCIEVVLDLVQLEQHTDEQWPASSSDEMTAVQPDQAKHMQGLGSAILAEIAAVQWLDRLGLAEHIVDGAEVVVQVRRLVVDLEVPCETTVYS